MTAITMTDAMISYRMSKVGSINSATRSKCVEIIKAAAKAGHDIWFVWGAGGGEHTAPPGLSLDLMVKNSTAGDWVRNYIWANRARLRLRHVIWEQHITSTVVSPGVRRAMADRGSTTNNHMDHNHVMFLDGAAYVPPNGSSTPSAPTKPETGDPTLERGDTGPRVLLLQKGLKASFPSYAGNLALDSSFGPDLQRVVMEFQRRTGLTTDGKVGPATRAALAKVGIVIPASDSDVSKTPAPAPAPKPTLPAGSLLSEDGKNGLGTRKAIQRMLGQPDDGSWGPATRRAIQRWAGVAQDGNLGPASRRAVQKRVGVKQTGVWDWDQSTKADPTTKALQAFYNRAVRARGKAY